MHNKNFTHFEKNVLRHFIFENELRFSSFTDQVQNASIIGRVKSNIGFTTELIVPEHIPFIKTMSTNTVLYLYGRHPEIVSSVNFMLWFSFGRLKTLEGMVNTGHWPNNENNFIFYPSYEKVPA